MCLLSKKIELSDKGRSMTPPKQVQIEHEYRLMVRMVKQFKFGRQTAQNMANFRRGLFEENKINFDRLTGGRFVV